MGQIAGGLRLRITAVLVQAPRSQPYRVNGGAWPTIRGICWCGSARVNLGDQASTIIRLELAVQYLQLHLFLIATPVRSTVALDLHTTIEDVVVST